METKIMYNSKRIKYILSFLVLIILLVLLDQFTKSLAVQFLKDQESVVLIPGVLELEYLENTGAAFGILLGKQWFFYIITIIMMFVLIFIYFKMPMNKKYLPGHAVLIFIISGAIGNFIDRVVQQYVVDFIYFSLINFPKFNFADIYITCGCFVMFFLVLFVYKDEDLQFLSLKK